MILLVCPFMLIIIILLTDNICWILHNWSFSVTCISICIIQYAFSTNACIFCQLKILFLNSYFHHYAYNNMKKKKDNLSVSYFSKIKTAFIYILDCNFCYKTFSNELVIWNCFLNYFSISLSHLKLINQKTRTLHFYILIFDLKYNCLEIRTVKFFNAALTAKLVIDLGMLFYFERQSEKSVYLFISKGKWMNWSYYNHVGLNVMKTYEVELAINLVIKFKRNLLCLLLMTDTPIFFSGAKLYKGFDLMWDNNSCSWIIPTYENDR